jgi:hypothetical protein
METPTIEGNKKKMSIVNALNNPLIAMGELTIFEEPVVTVMLSKMPAEDADKNTANTKKIAQ